MFFMLSKEDKDTKETENKWRSKVPEKTGDVIWSLVQEMAMAEGKTSAIEIGKKATGVRRTDKSVRSRNKLRTWSRLLAETSMAQGVVDVWIHGWVDRGAGTGDRADQKQSADVGRPVSSVFTSSWQKVMKAWTSMLVVELTEVVEVIDLLDVKNIK